jgi:hypothetical protein
MTYMRSWKSHRLTSHTWLGLNPQIGRPLSRIVGAIGLLFFIKSLLNSHVFVIQQTESAADFFFRSLNR